MQTAVSHGGRGSKQGHDNTGDHSQLEAPYRGE